MIDQFLGLFVGQEETGLGNGDLPAFKLLRHQVAEQVLEVDPHFLQVHRSDDLHERTRGRGGDVHFDRPVLHLSVLQPAPELFARRPVLSLIRMFRIGFNAGR